jgi:hypothetical protein
MPRNLNEQGQPTAAYCRHCDAKRIGHGGALLCVECDMTAMMTVEGEQAELSGGDE